MEYQIDSSHRLVRSRAWGVLTAQEVTDHTLGLRDDPEFDPTFDELLDGTAITEIQASREDVKSIAAVNPWGLGARRAAAMSLDVAFGMARQYEAYAVESGNDFRVFRSLEEARAWLGLDRGEQ